MTDAADLILLEAAARAAGWVAMRHWGRAPKVWDKGDGAGPVTEADLEVNDLLARDLCAARPAYGWLSEESPDDGARLAADRVFIIDPIDGTRAFVEGSADFAHSLAVAEGGQVVAAVVYLPARDLIYTATAGGTACLNGVPIRASDRGDVTGARVLTSRASLGADHWRGGLVPPFQRKFRSSLAWRLCLVAEGAFDGMLTLRPTWEWDVAAGSLIAARAGARVSDRAGAAPGFNRPDARLDGCLAAAAGVHQGLMAALAGA